MSALQLEQVHVVDPGGPSHGSVVDILIEGGRITRIGARLPKGKAKRIGAPGLHVSPGWVDMGAHFREPGEEYKEGVENGLNEAARGGYTAVCVLPSTHPVVDSRAQVEYLLRRATGHAVRLLPLAAISQGLEGRQLAELHDMHRAGAVGFTDDLRTRGSVRLLLLALQYVSPFQGLVLAHADEADLSAGGQMHEGAMSARLGLRGIPAMAEAIGLRRNVDLLAYTGSRMHIPLVSTAEGVAIIAEGKRQGLRLSASVAAHHLLLDDGCLRGFDSRYKVFPPLRSARHIEALREAVKEGVIDHVVSDHRPEDTDHKRVEFGQAAPGMIGLTTTFAAANTALKGRMSTRRIVERFCHGPRRILGLDVPHVVEGERAEITLFDPDHEWTYTRADVSSRSDNSPYIGQRFTGRSWGVVTPSGVMISPALAG